MLFTQGSTFLANLSISNLLGKEGFGRYALVQSTLVTAAGIAQLCTGLAVRKFVSEHLRSDVGRASRVFGLCLSIAFMGALLASATIVLGARIFAEQLLKSPDLTVALRASAVYVVFAVLGGVFTGFLAGMERYAVLTVGAASAGIAQLLVIRGFAKEAGLAGPLGGLVAASFVGAAILSVSALAGWRRLRAPSPFSGMFSERSVLLGFILPGALIALWSGPSSWLACVLLARGPDGEAQVAFFTAANQYRLVTLFIPGILNGVGVSMLNSHRGEGDAGSFSRTFRWILGFNLVYSAVLVGGGYAFSRELLAIFGHEFVDGRPTFLILLVSGAIEVAALTLYLVIQARGDIWRSLCFVNIPMALILVGGSAYLSPRFGSVGLATAQAAGWAFALLIIVVLVLTRRDLAFNAVPRSAG